MANAVGVPVSTLPNHWHPFATCDEVTEQPHRLTLLGTDHATFRSNGFVSVFTDPCNHRGVASSFGFIEEGILESQDNTIGPTTPWLSAMANITTCSC